MKDGTSGYWFQCLNILLDVAAGRPCRSYCLNQSWTPAPQDKMTRLVVEALYAVGRKNAATDVVMVSAGAIFNN